MNRTSLRAHLDAMCRRLLLAAVATLMAAPAVARPNFGRLTDGRHLIDVSGDEGHLTLCFTDGRRLRVSLTQCDRTEYKVDISEEDTARALPLGVVPGGRALRDGNWNFHFFDADGRLCGSLRLCDGSEEEAARMRRQDSLLIVQGAYRWTGGQELVFSLSDEGEPQLTVGH